MNILIAYIVSILGSWGFNIAKIRFLLNELKERNLDVNLKSKNTQDKIDKEILISLIPIFNIIMSMGEYIHYMDNNEKVIEKLKEEKILILKEDMNKNEKIELKKESKLIPTELSNENKILEKELKLVRKKNKR